MASEARSWRRYFQKICQENNLQICTLVLSFIRIVFSVHKLFEWLSRNEGNAFNIEAFDLFSVLITSFGFHCAIPFV